MPASVGPGDRDPGRTRVDGDQRAAGRRATGSTGGTSRISREYLEGDLSDRHLPDYLQLLQNQRRVGQLLIESQHADGAPLSGGLYIEDGEVTHATMAPYEGRLAFHAILALDVGRFAFFGGARPPRRTIDEPFHALLIDGLRQQDERRHLEADLPDRTTVLHPNHDRWSCQETVCSFGHWCVWQLVDGRRSLDQIVRVSQADPVVVLRRLRDLLQLGLITTVPDTRFLAGIVLRRLPAEARQHLGDRAPGPAAVHLLRAVDGRRSLREIAEAVRWSEAEVIEVARQLVRGAWVDAVAGHDALRRHLG